MSSLLHFGRLRATVSEIVDAGDLLPDYELAAITVLEGVDRPGEEPATRRRLRADGIRPTEHRGALLLDPGELERFSSVGCFHTPDEVLFSTQWHDEFEPFPGRLTSDVVDFLEGVPLGLEEWMLDTHTVLVLGDGSGLNYATTLPGLEERLQSRFRPVGR